MIGPPRSKPGIVRGTDPAAKITLAPCAVAVEPSAIVIFTVRLAPSEPVPLNTVTLRDLHNPPMPLTSPSTILALRACVVAKLTAGALASIPNSAAWAT